MKQGNTQLQMANRKTFVQGVMHQCSNRLYRKYWQEQTAKNFSINAYQSLLGKNK